MSRTGVMLVGFGGPDSLDAVAPFMCNLMGAEPSDELVARVCGRYLAIGGKSPLGEIAGEMASALEAALGRIGHQVPVRVGMRYWDPFIGDALEELVALGCDKVVTVSLSPFESKVAHGAYRTALAEAAAAVGDVEIVEAPLISELPAYVDFYAMATASALEDLEPNEGTAIAFTAHSLPLEDLEENDPYVMGLRRVASSVAAQLGLEPGALGAGVSVLGDSSIFGTMVAPRPWFIVYQSAGQRPGGWLGPDINVIVHKVAEAGMPAVVVVPLGFATDHLETLYDLDIVAADEAIKVDMGFVRAAVPNQDERLIDAMAESVGYLL